MLSTMSAVASPPAPDPDGQLTARPRQYHHGAESATRAILSGLSVGTEPFDPPGVTWTRVSPRLATVRRLGVLVVAVPLALATPAGGLRCWTGPRWRSRRCRRPASRCGCGWLIGRQARAWGYAEREDDLLVRHGVLCAGDRRGPYGRMQFVDVRRARWTAPSASPGSSCTPRPPATDAAIPGVPAVEAARLRDRLASRGQARLAGL